jgi:hypothetical protein
MLNQIKSNVRTNSVLLQLNVWRKISRTLSRETLFVNTFRCIVSEHGSLRTFASVCTHIRCLRKTLLHERTWLNYYWIISLKANLLLHMILAIASVLSRLIYFQRRQWCSHHLTWKIPSHCTQKGSCNKFRNLVSFRCSSEVQGQTSNGK